MSFKHLMFNLEGYEIKKIKFSKIDLIPDCAFLVPFLSSFSNF